MQFLIRSITHLRLFTLGMKKNSLECIGHYEKYIYLERPYHVLFKKDDTKYDIAMSSCDVIKTVEKRVKMGKIYFVLLIFH